MIRGQRDSIGTILHYREEITGTGPGPVGVVNRFELDQNYPNPFNPETRISFEINQGDYTSVVIYNINGKELQKLINRYLNAGSHSVVLKVNEEASGIYLYRLISGNYSQTKKMMLLR